MEELLTTLEEILQRDCKVTAEGGAYYLKEIGVAAYPRTLLKQKGKMLIYSFDKANSNELVFGIFNAKVKGLTSICDYFIFYPFQEKLFVFICDLKSSKSTAKNQVETGYVLAQFIVNMMRKQLRFKEIEIEYRALIFSISKTPKFSTSLSEAYILLKDSNLKNKLLKSGNDVFLDSLCF